MEQVLNHLVVLAGIIATMCVAYFAWVVSGVGNMAVKSSLKNWSWKRFRTDLIKLACFAVSMMACSIVSDVVAYYVATLEIEALNQFMTVISWSAIVGIPIVATIYLLYRSLSNNKSLVGYNQALKTIGKDEKEIKITDNSKEIAEKIHSFFEAPEDLAEKHKEFEQEGGQGQYYSVSTDSYDAFRAATFGRGFNVDNAYGAQCWDLCCVLWQQFGQSLQTGNGCAYGCWTLRRDVNKNPNFNLITNKADVKRGDVVVFGGGQYGHIGFADENYNGGASIRVLGQNQGGTPYPGGGSYTNVVNVSMGGFLGAFRLKKWESKAPTPKPETKPATNPAPKPTPKPTPTEPHQGYKVGDVVVPTKKVDAFGTRLTQYDPSYVITGFRDDVNGAILSARGQIWAVMPFSSIKKA